MRKAPQHMNTRKRGSLLILCVTVLVIIALIGIAFLQRVRIDQAASSRYQRNYMNLVINGILGEVSDQMKKDIDDNKTDALLYDYPWTKDLAEFDTFLDDGTPVKVNGSNNSEDDRWLASTAPVFVPGGSRDRYHWLHLTNLTGIWLDLPAVNGGNDSPRERPIVGLPGRVFDSDTDLEISTDPFKGLLSSRIGGYEPRGVDADGDGLADSQWQWAPVSVREMGGRKYVVALRIVDLNSMLNVNTATALTNTGADTVPNVARGYNPGWVDLSRLLARIDDYSTNISPSDWENELVDIFKVRGKTGQSDEIVSITNLNSLTTAARDIQKLWEEQGSIYGSFDRNITIESELELRNLGGINDTSKTSTLEAVMGASYPAGEKLSKLLRQHPKIIIDLKKPEIAYPDVVSDDPLPPGETVEARISRWFYGSRAPVSFNDSDEDGDSLRVADRGFRAIRHFITTASGVGDYSPIFDGPSFSASDLKFDLNRDWTGVGTATDLDDLSEQIRQVFHRNRASGGGYLGLPVLGRRSIDDLVAEYVIAIKDYSDSDSTPTGRPLSGTPPVTAYGMEKLPFIREVYFHQLYEDQNLLGVDQTTPIDASTNPDDFIFDTWVAKNGTQGIIIELGNPFSHEIKGDDLQSLIRVVIEQNSAIVGTPWVYNDTAVTRQNIGPRNDTPTDVDDTLLLVSNQTDTASKDVNNRGADLELDMNLTGAPNLLTIPLGDELSFNVGGGPITVRLEVNVAGTFIPYDRLVTNISFDSQLAPPHPQSATPNAPVPPQYIQSSFWRNGDRINYIADGTGTGRIRTVPDIAIPPTFDQHNHHLLSDNKNPLTPGTPLPDSMQLPLPDLPMRSVAEIGWVHMFGFTDGPNGTFPERMDTGGLGPPPIPLNEHFLLIDPTDPDYDVIVDYGIPHAAMLMDVLTTVSPRDDGLDNDNDDGDNDIKTSFDSVSSGQPEELFTPGMINVNTAPLHILTLGAPLGENLDDTERLMRTIVAYRDEPIRETGGHGPYWSPSTAGFDVTRARDRTLPNNVPLFLDARLNLPGIASLGELMYLNPGNPGNDMQRYGLDGDDILPAGVDLYPDPDDPTATAPPLDQGDDNEQRLARFSMLSQAFTVRSDRFVVYGVVRGYDDKQFNQLPVETSRFIAIIDRSSMATPEDKPRVIGFVRLQ